MNKGKTNLIAFRIALFFIAFSGIVSLLINEVFRPFLKDVPEVELIIILVSVFSVYHAILTFTIRSIVKDENDFTNQLIRNYESKNNIMKDSVPYSALDDIEFRHGHKNKDNSCEMWIISNTLQESKNDDSMLLAIYENITKNRVRYYYILPDTKKSLQEIDGLCSRLNEIHKRKKSKLTGAVFFRYDESILKFLTSDYFDIVLFVDCDSNGNPYVIGDTKTCEGYQCFSRVLEDDGYLYQVIEPDKVLDIRDFHKDVDFSTMKIGDKE